MPFAKCKYHRKPYLIVSHYTHHKRVTAQAVKSMIYSLYHLCKVLRLPVHNRRRSLVVGEYQSISNDNVLPPSSSEDNSLSNVIGCERFATTTYS